MTCLRDQVASQLGGLLASLSEPACLSLLEIRLGTLGARGRLLPQPMGENVGACMGCGRRGFRGPECATPAARARFEVTWTRPQTLRGHAPGATRPIVDVPTPRREHFAATHLVRGTAPQPGPTRLVRRPLTPLAADGGEDGMERQGLSARPWREVDAGDPGPRGAESTRGCGFLGVPMGSRRWG